MEGKKIRRRFSNGRRHHFYNPKENGHFRNFIEHLQGNITRFCFVHNGTVRKKYTANSYNLKNRAMRIMPLLHFSTYGLFRTKTIQYPDNIPTSVPHKISSG